jgi:outer membrane murein-binding lipoprotein Lpp
MSQMTSTARVGARALNRPETTTPRLRVVTGAPLRRGSAAFGIVCAILLAAGLAGLLVLNTTLAQGSFTVQKLQATSDQLTDAQAALNQSVDAAKSPASLATRATRMGMVPAESAAFLRLSDGKVIGVAKPASRGQAFNVVGTTSSPPAPAVTKPAKKAPAATAVKSAKTAKTATAAPAPSATRPATPASVAPRSATPAKR